MVSLLQGLAELRISFPQARYTFLIASTPERHGGRTAPILRNAQLFEEHAGHRLRDCQVGLPG